MISTLSVVLLVIMVNQHVAEITNLQISVTSIDSTSQWLETDENGNNNLYIVVNTAASLILSAVADVLANTRYTAAYGDGVLYSICNDGTNSSVSVTQTYYTTGEYVIEFYVDNNVTEAWFSMNVAVIEAFSATLLATPSTVDLVEGQNFMVVVDRDPSDTKEYSGVTCYFTDPDNVTYTVLDDDVMESPDSFNTTLNFNTLGVVDVDFTCDNRVTRKNVIFSPTVYARLSNIKLSVSNPVSTTTDSNKLTRYDYSPTDIVTLDVTGNNGVAQQYVYILDWGDGTTTNLSAVSPFQNQTEQHTYPSNMNQHFKPNIIIIDAIGPQQSGLTLGPGMHNDSGIYVWDHNYNDYAVVEIVGGNTLYTDVNLTAEYLLYISNNTAEDRLPTFVHCSWDYYGALNATENPTANAPVNVTSNYTLTQLLTHTGQDDPHQQVQIDCSTPIGQQTVLVDIIVVIPLTDVTITTEHDVPYVVAGVNTLYYVNIEGANNGAIIIIEMQDLEAEERICATGQGLVGNVTFNSTVLELGFAYFSAFVTDGRHSLNYTLEVEAITLVEDMSVIYNGEVDPPSLLLIYPNTSIDVTVLYDPGVTDNSTTPLPRYRVECQIDYDDGSQESQYIYKMGAGEENAMNFTHTLVYVSGETEFNLTVNCSNPLSVQVFTTTVNIFRAISHVSVSVAEDYYAINVPVTIHMSGLGGETQVGFMLDYDVTPTEIENICKVGFTGNISHNYTYIEPNDYWVLAIGYDNVAFSPIESELLIRVQVPINDRILFSGTQVILYSSNMSAVYDITLDTLAVGEFVPSSVNCTYIFPHYNTSVLVSDGASWLNPPQENYSVIYTGPSQVIELYCYNFLSTSLSNITLEIKRSLEEFALSVDLTNQTLPDQIRVSCDAGLCYVPEGEDVNFIITGLYGDLAITYDLTNMSVATLTVTKISHENFTQAVASSVLSQGTTSITISAVETEFTPMLYHSTTSNIITQKAVDVSHMMNIEGSDKWVYPMDEGVWAGFAISLPVGSVPSNLSCELSSISGVNTSIDITNANAVLPQMSINSSIDLAYGAVQNITAHCSNKVSYVDIFKTIEIFKRINNVQLTAPTACEINVNCSLELTAHDGQTPLDYIINYSDGINSDHICKDAHENQTLVNVYVNSGVYTVTLIILDTGGVTRVEVDINVENPVVELDLLLNTTDYAIYEADDLYIIHEVQLDLLPTATNVPTNASCIWIWPNATESEPEILTISSTWLGISANMTLDTSTEQVKDVSIFCENLISNGTVSAQVQLKARLAHLTIDVNSDWANLPDGDFASTNIDIDFEITGINGNYSVVNVVYPKYNYASNVTLELIQDPFENHTMVYRYDLPMVVHVMLVVTDTYGPITAPIRTLNVEQPLETMTINVKMPTGGELSASYVSGDTTVYTVFWTNRTYPSAIPEAAISFNLIHTRGLNTLSEPTNVTCVAVHTDDTTLVSAGDNSTSYFTFENGPIAVHSAAFVEFPGLHTTTIYCSNHVSNLTESVTYLQMENIRDVRLTTTQFLGPISTEYNFTLTRTSGNDVTYVVKYVDGSGADIFLLSQRVEDYEYQFSFTFPDFGHHYLTIEGSNLAQNEAGEMYPLLYMDIQAVVENLEVIVDYTVDNAQIPNAKQIGPFTFTVQALPTYSTPATVYFEWSFSNGDTWEDKPNVADWVEHDKEFSFAEAGHVTLDLRAYNNISEQQMSVNITVIEDISGLTLESDLICATPNQTVTFTSTITAGSHVTYVINCDGDVQTFSYDHTYRFQPEVLNRQETYLCQFLNPGNYTVTVTATNEFSSDTAEYDIVIQYPVPHFIISGLQNVLTPPGHMWYAIERLDNLTFIPNDVTCNWTYVDNTVKQETKTYIPNWDSFPENVSYEYKPDRHSITPTVSVGTSCGNCVTPTPQTAEIVITIVPHLVDIGRLEMQNLAEYNESMLWSLEVDLYGHNPCFLWTFTNISYRALFGRAECKTLPQFIGNWDEYVLSTSDNTTINFALTQGINNWDILPGDEDGMWKFALVEVCVEVENSISANDTVCTTGIVVPLSCDPPTADVGPEGSEPETARKIYYSQHSTLFGVTTTNCSYQHSFTATWDAYVYVPGRHRGNLFGRVSDKPDYTHLKGSLPIGIYYLDFIVNMKAIPIPIISRDHMYLQVIETPIVTDIVGGVQKDVSAVSGELVKFDAWPGSIDPDLMDPEEKGNMTWKWYCELGATADSSALTAYNWTNNTGFDSGDCGDINPFQPGLPSPQDDGKLEFDGSSLTAGERYQFTVQVSKVNRGTAIASQTVTAKDQPTLVLGLECVRNCHYWINPDTSSRLKSRCLSCGNQDVIYSWKFEMKESGIYTPVNLSSPFTLQIGTAGTKRYQVTCLGWEDDEEEDLAQTNSRRKRAASSINSPNLQYEMLANVSTTGIDTNMLLSYGRNAVSPPTYMPLGSSDNNYTVPLYITIIDSMGTSAQVPLFVSNLFPDNVTETYLIELLKELKKIADARDIQTSTQIIWSYISLHNIAGLPTEMNMTAYLLGYLYADGEVNHNVTLLRTTDYYILQLQKLTPNFPNELKQIIELLRILSKDLQNTDLNTGLRQAMDIVYNSMPFLELVADSMTTEALYELCFNYVSTIGQLMDIGSEIAYNKLRNDCDYQTCEDGIIESIENLNKRLTEQVNYILDVIGKVLLRDTVFGENATVLDTGSLVFIAHRIQPENLSGYAVQSRMASMLFPENSSFADDVNVDCLDVNYAVFKRNPYTWNVTARSVNAPVQQARFFECSTRDRQFLGNTTDENPYELTHTLPEQEPFNWTLTELTNTSRQLAYHTFWMNDSNSYAQLYFNKEYFKDISFELFIIYEGDPNTNNYDFTTELPLGIPTDTELHYEYVSNATDNFTETTYTYIVPRNETTRLGLYTVGVLVKAYDDTGAKLLYVNYTFDVQYISCKLWSEELNTWQSDNCEINPETNIKIVVFKSTVFDASFGAGVLIGPNTIDFGTVFDNGWAKLLENIHILATMVFFLLVYVVLLVFAVKLDKLDALNWAALPVAAAAANGNNSNNSNNSDDFFHYDIEVFTGLQSNAGTKSNVYLIVVGKDSETSIMHLHTEGRENFKRGSMNKFSTMAKMHLGKILYVHVYHDNSGEGKQMDWFLEKIVVKDKTEDKKYLFLCDKWLSIDKGDFKTDKMLKLVSKYQMLQFKGMFTRRAITNIIEDNLWVSTIFRRNEDPFSRVQRITAAVTLIFLAMIANAMWYGKGDSEVVTDGINIGPLTFTVQSLMVSIYSILTVLPGTLIILLLFTKSKARNKKNNQEILKKYTDTDEDQDIDPDFLANTNQNNSNYVAHYDDVDKLKDKQIKPKGIDFSGRFLPFWCVYIAYFLCFATIVLSGFFTILYSFEWGGKKSAQWLSAFLLSFLESEGLISPVKAVVLAILISILCKKPVDQTDDYADEDDDFIYSEDENEELAEEEMEKIRFRRWLQEQIEGAVKVLIWHVLFLICLLLVTFGNRDPNSFKCNEELKYLFFDDASEVASQADFWDYLKDSALPNLFYAERYNGQSVSSLDRQFIVNSYARRLGPPAIRQFRVEKDACKTVTPLINSTCNVDYSNGKEDQNSYLLNWQALPRNYTMPSESDLGLQQAFTYDSGDATNYEYWGQFNSYSGRGYAYPLGVSLQETEANVDELTAARWVDKYTRAVVLEMNVYNANVNLFSMVTIIVEFPSFGSSLVSYEIKTVKLYRYIGGPGLFNLIAELIITIFIIALIIRLIINMVKQKAKFFTSVWNLSEIIKLICGLAFVGLYILRTMMIQAKITEMMNNREKLSNFRGITLVDELCIYVIGFATFLQILQLLWVFKFNKSLGILGGTLRHSMPGLSSFLVVISVLFMAFVVVHYYYYGTELYEYRDVLQTCYAQLGIILGAFRANDFEDAAGQFGRVLFITFQLSMVFVYMNMLVTIIMDVYGGVNDGEFDTGEEHKAFDMLTEKIKASSDEDNHKVAIDDENA